MDALKKLLAEHIEVADHRFSYGGRWACACGAKGMQSNSSHKTHLADAIVASDWAVKQKAEGARDALLKAADAIEPGEHYCYFTMCPYCAMRNTKQQIKTNLLNLIALEYPHKEGNQGHEQYGTRG